MADMTGGFKETVSGLFPEAAGGTAVPGNRFFLLLYIDTASPKSLFVCSWSNLSRV